MAKQKSSFKLKSGNSPIFKHLGSSPFDAKSSPHKLFGISRQKRKDLYNKWQQGSLKKELTNILGENATTKISEVFKPNLVGTGAFGLGKRDVHGIKTSKKGYWKYADKDEIFYKGKQFKDKDEYMKFRGITTMGTGEEQGDPQSEHYIETSSKYDDPHWGPGDE